jgi:hypothetical protein
MRAHHFKNILNLFKKTTDTFSLVCKSKDELVIHLIDESTNELLYHFEIMSDNKLTKGFSYTLNVNDLYRLFKYIKSDALIVFIEEETIVLKIITSLDMSQTLVFPKIKEVACISGTDISYDNFVCNPKVLVRLSDFSRIIKSLKNTSDLYVISIEDNKFIIRNEDAVIPISYALRYEDDTRETVVGVVEPTIISNNCLLKLNKLSSDNTLIEVGKNFISGIIENELKYYIQFIVPLNCS